MILIKNFQKKMDKKGMSQMWWIISTAVIALVVVILLLVWFKSSGGKLFENIDTTIDDLKDSDKDGVTDFFDKCPCDASKGENLEPGEECKPKKDPLTRKCPNVT
jgi:predicted PurR-regulated permease PerM